MAERRTDRRQRADTGSAEEARDEEDDTLEDDDDAQGDDDGARDARDPGAGRRSSRRERGGTLTAAQAAQAGLRQIAELTGKPLEGVTGIERAEDGWTVGAEVVEDRRVPSSTDILAIYEADLDRSGELVSYRRVRRYARGRGDSSEES
jgi:hypothetical protein